jgi:hypothetical protein
MAEPREEGHAVGWQREDDFFLLAYEVGRDGKGKSGPKVGTGAGTCGVSEKNITFFGINTPRIAIFMVGLPFWSSCNLTGGFGVRGKANPNLVRKFFDCFCSLYYRR